MKILLSTLSSNMAVLPVIKGIHPVFIVRLKAMPLSESRSEYLIQKMSIETNYNSWSSK